MCPSALSTGGLVQDGLTSSWGRKAHDRAPARPGSREVKCTIQSEPKDLRTGHGRPGQEVDVPPQADRTHCPPLPFCPIGPHWGGPSSHSSTDSNANLFMNPPWAQPGDRINHHIIPFANIPTHTQMMKKNQFKCKKSIWQQDVY